MRVPDKKTVMCGFLIRPFYFAGRERNGLINRENPTNLLQVSVRRLWQRHDHIGLLYRGHGDGGAVSGAGRRSGAGCGGAGVEHHLQLGFADRHWGFCTVQYAPGAGEAPAGQPGLYCGAGLYGDSGGGQLAGPNLL